MKTFKLKKTCKVGKNYYNLNKYYLSSHLFFNIYFQNMFQLIFKQNQSLYFIYNLNYE